MDPAPAHAVDDTAEAPLPSLVMGSGHRTGAARTAVDAVVCGALLGLVDFVWIKFVPAPLGELGNSSAVWAVAAFTFGYRVRTGPLRVALGAAALLVLAVPGYYAAATLIQHDDVSAVWAVPSMLWMFFGVLAGVVFGTAGGWARAEGWRRVVGAAAPGAVLFAEAALLAGRVGRPNYGNGPLWPAIVDVALGVLVIALVARTPGRWALAAAVAVPLALVGFGGFLLAGFA